MIHDSHPRPAPDRTGPAAPLDAAPETFCSSGPSPTVHLVGLGRVARALCAQLAHAGIRVIGATDSTATIFDRAGLDPSALAEHKARGRSLREWRGSERLPSHLAIELIPADVVVDATSTDLADPLPAVARVDAALRRGAAVALAAKDGLGVAAHRWLAEPTRARVGCNAVLGGAGARLVAELAELRSDAESVAVTGNATTTTIVQVVEAGGEIADGIELARERGLLEADAELDLRGLDAAVKLTIVAAALSGAAQDVSAVPLHDVRDLDVTVVRERARRGATTRLVGRWDPRGGARLAFEELPATSPLAVPPDRVAYGYRLRDGATRVHVGTGIGPLATAAALYEDVARFCRAATLGVR